MADDLAIAAAFLGLLVIQITRHQMWRDETNAWGLVLASPTLAELFHNLHYEGHPGLWHLSLWCVAWITHAPVAMQIVQAGIAAGFILLIALRSPFSRLEKVLLLLNYYIVFEYAVLSRNYGIGLLIALIYARLRVTRPDRLVLNAIVLGLLANTNIYAAILSVALASEATVDWMVALRHAPRRAVYQLVPAVMVYTAFLLLCVATVWPARDISWRTTGYPLQHIGDPHRLQAVIVHYLDVGLVPPAQWLDALPSPAGMVFGLCLLPIISATVIWLFSRDWRPLLVLGLTALGTVAFGQLVYQGSIRHWGIMFVAFVVALWLQPQRGPGRSWVVLAVLAFGALAGVVAIGHEAAQPYSRAGATAEWLRHNEPSDAALIGTPDTSAAGVAVLLGRPVYLLDCSCVDTFLRFSKRRDDYRSEQLPDRLATAMRAIATRPAVLMTASPLSQDVLTAIAARHISAEPVAAFTGAFQPEEDFYLYHVTDAVHGG